MNGAVITAVTGVLTWAMTNVVFQYYKKEYRLYDIDDLKNELTHSGKQYIFILAVYLGLYGFYIYTLWTLQGAVANEEKGMYFICGALSILVSLTLIGFPLVHYCRLLRMTYNIQERTLPFDTKERLVKLVSHIISQDSYSHSMKYLQECTKKYPYGEFIKDFAEKTAIKPEDLDTTIRTIITQSTGAVFYCVLADESYYAKDHNDILNSQLSEQTKELIKYFLSFETGIRKNVVSRIFSEEAQCCGQTEVGDIYIKDENKSMILFQYLCINYITMVNTYLLLYNKDVVKDNIQQFLYNIDYVLSIGGIDSEMKDKKNTLYFSYPNDKGINSIIQTSDELLIRIALTDFEKRLSTLDLSQRRGQHYQCIMMDDKDTSLKMILRALKLSPAKAVTALGLVIIYIHSISESDLKEEVKLFVVRKLIDLKTKITRFKENEESKENK